MFAARLFLVLPSILLVLAAQAQPARLVALSPAQQRQVVSLGPWPAEPSVDPSNRVSGERRAIELGRRLFRDPRMSPVGYIACVTCHQPDRAFTDRRARAHGLADLPRNTPALANLRQVRWYGWGGASDSLWLASIRPMLDAREFDGSPSSITRIFERDPELAACYAAVFGEPPVRDATQTIVNVGKALAAFQETLVTGRTAFDDFRDALARKDALAQALYPAPARRGLQLFVGAGGCAGCHGGPNLSDGDFHAVVAPGVGLRADGDRGRQQDVERLRDDPLNLLGRFNDDAQRRHAGPTRALRADASLRGRYRTPSLRNVAVTAPYMHDGRFEQLSDAVRHGGDPGQAAAMTRAQVDDIVAFLSTLTDANGERRPWSSETLHACP